MKKVPLAGLLLIYTAGSVGAATNALANHVSMQATSFCSRYGCRQVMKTQASYLSGDRIETTYRLRRLDAKLSSSHTLDGILTDTTLTFERSPLSLEDAATVAVLTKSMIGQTYSDQRLEKCFDAADKNREEQYPYNGEAFLATGEAWGIKCFVHDYRNVSVSSIYIFIGE